METTARDRRLRYMMAGQILFGLVLSPALGFWATASPYWPFADMQRSPFALVGYVPFALIGVGIPAALAVIIWNSMLRTERQVQAEMQRHGASEAEALRASLGAFVGQGGFLNMCPLSAFAANGLALESAVLRRLPRLPASGSSSLAALSAGPDGRGGCIVKARTRLALLRLCLIVQFLALPAAYRVPSDGGHPSCRPPPAHVARDPAGLAAVLFGGLILLAGHQAMGSVRKAMVSGEGAHLHPVAVIGWMLGVLAYALARWAGWPGASPCSVCTSSVSATSRFTCGSSGRPLEASPSFDLAEVKMTPQKRLFVLGALVLTQFTGLVVGLDLGPPEAHTPRLVGNVLIWPVAIAAVVSYASGLLMAYVLSALTRLCGLRKVTSNSPGCSGSLRSVPGSRPWLLRPSCSRSAGRGISSSSLSASPTSRTSACAGSATARPFSPRGKPP